MRYLNTHLPCKRLKQKLKNPPTNEVSAKKAWRRFNKKDTRKACYKLQQGICAYTELSLDSELLGSHIEHIAPRSRFPDRTFMPDNLVLSILSDGFAGTLDEQERFAGHHKKNQYDDKWFISPYDENCEDYFYYCPETGWVSPMQALNEPDQLKAVQTIIALNLNCDYLVRQRLMALRPLEQKINALLISHANNKDSLLALRQFSEGMLITVNKKLPEFYTAKRQLFDRYIQQLQFE